MKELFRSAKLVYKPIPPELIDMYGPNFSNDKFHNNLEKLLNVLDDYKLFVNDLKHFEYEIQFSLENQNGDEGDFYFKYRKNGDITILRSGSSSSPILKEMELVYKVLKDSPHFRVSEHPNQSSHTAPFLKLAAIEKEKDIREAIHLLEDELKKDSVLIKNRVLGFQSGNISCDVFWNKEHAFWYYFDYEIMRNPQIGIPRTVICLGLENPNEKKNLNITSEFNIPIQGLDKRVAGCILTDGSDIHIGHSGGIGGGRQGVSKKGLVAYWREQLDKELITVDWGNDKTHELLFVSSINSSNLQSELKEFIYTVSKYKEEMVRFIHADELPELVEKSMVLKAIERIDKDGIYPHGKNHTFEVIHEGCGYPPLALLAFALEEINGEEVPPGTLRGELGSKEFRLLRDAGFSIARVQSEIDERESEIEKRRAKKKKGRTKRNPGSDKPQAVAKTRREYKRDQDVVDEVLFRANGTCEGCEEKSKFISKSTGEPYLEVHHIIPLSDNGPDRTWNAVAICPNCHRRCHYAEDCEKYNESFYKKIYEVHRP
jgi:5-methylcytosine-specific restriction endonuclease McrA